MALACHTGNQSHKAPAAHIMSRWKASAVQWVEVRQSHQMPGLVIKNFVILRDVRLENSPQKWNTHKSSPNILSKRHDSTSSGTISQRCRGWRSRGKPNRFRGPGWNNIQSIQWSFHGRGSSRRLDRVPDVLSQLETNGCSTPAVVGVLVRHPIELRHICVYLEIQSPVRCSIVEICCVRHKPIVQTLRGICRRRVYPHKLADCGSTEIAVKVPGKSTNSLCNY